MKKFIVLMLALLVLFSASSVFARGGQEQGVRVFRMACNHAPDFPTNVGNFAFVEYVYRETNGRIRIDLFHSEQLGSETETVQLTQLGEVAFNRLGVAFLASVNPQIGAFAMPFVYRDPAHMFRVLDGPLGDEARRMLIPQGLYGLCWYDAGARHFFTNSASPVRRLEDLRGLRIRAMPTPALMDAIRLLGASPTPMGMGEVYSAIQNGVVEGAENNWPSYYSWSFHEVAPHFTLSGHMAAPEMILVNVGVWNSFSAEDQRIIYRAAAHAAQVQRASWLEFEQRAERSARAAGTQVHTLSPAEQQRFVDALSPMLEMPAWAPVAPLVNRIRAVP